MLRSRERHGEATGDWQGHRGALRRLGARVALGAVLWALRGGHRRAFAQRGAAAEDPGLRHIILYYIILYYIILYCIVLYYIILYYIILYYIVLYCIVLYYIILYYIILYCIVLYCIVLYCIVLYCIVLYCIVLYCIVLYYIIPGLRHRAALGALWPAAAATLEDGEAGDAAHLRQQLPGGLGAP